MLSTMPGKTDLSQQSKRSSAGFSGLPPIDPIRCTSSLRRSSTLTGEDQVQIPTQSHQVCSQVEGAVLTIVQHIPAEQQMETAAAEMLVQLLEERLRRRVACQAAIKLRRRNGVEGDIPSKPGCLRFSA